MKSLYAPTELFIERERTYLTADALAGTAVVIQVANSNGFSISDFVCIGTQGTEQAELAKVTAKTDTTITIGTTVLAHKQDEPMTVFRYDQRKFYGSLTSGGTYSELVADGSPVDIQVGDPQGTYIEYTGAEGYLYFKATYYNSQTLTDTMLTEAIPTLADESTRYCSIYAIKKQTGLLRNPYIANGDIDTYRKRAENEVNSYIFERYQLPLVTEAGTSEIPFIIENVTMLLAGGYMDYREYGKDGEGVKWLGEARAILKALQKGTQRLIDSTGNAFVQKTLTRGVQSYPQEVDNTNGPKRWATMDQIF